MNDFLFCTRPPIHTLAGALVVVQACKVIAINQESLDPSAEHFREVGSCWPVR